MKLELGKRYVLRDGRITEPLKYDDCDSVFVFRDGPRTWRYNGKWSKWDSFESLLDIVSEYTPEPEEKEMKLELELGKRYVLRDGRITGLLVEGYENPDYPYLCEYLNESWTEAGIWALSGYTSTLDIISEYLPELEDNETDDLKHDGGKPPMALLSNVALEEIAKVLAHGAKKYSPDGWREGMKYRRLISAAYRHLGAFQDGEDLDPETGISHLAHLGCCVMFLLEYQLKGRGEDDRFKG